jgi:hypothetical protein
MDQVGGVRAGAWGGVRNVLLSYRRPPQANRLCSGGGPVRWVGMVCMLQPQSTSGLPAASFACRSVDDLLLPQDMCVGMRVCALHAVVQTSDGDWYLWVGGGRLALPLTEYFLGGGPARGSSIQRWVMLLLLATGMDGHGDSGQRCKYLYIEGGCMD